MNEKVNKKQVYATGCGSGYRVHAGIRNHYRFIGNSYGMAEWLGLTDGQVGILSGALTFAIAAGSLLAGNITKALGLIRSF